MKIHMTAAVAVLMLGVAAPGSSASAFDYEAPRGHYTGFVPYEPDVTGSIGLYGSRNPAACPMSSAAEGNAD